tara:strand:- start:3619 stop:5052 length:1434 start_codon:yes stop_codon:yes gene_type:complete
MKNLLTKNFSMREDIIITFINSLIVMGGVFSLNGLIARFHGLETLGEFLLLKRTFFTAVSLFLFGSNLGLTNYISKNDDRTYGDAALHLFLVFSLPFIAGIIIGLQWSQIEGINKDVFWPYYLFALGICLQILAYSLFRGYLNMIGASVVQLVGTAVIPIILFLLLDDLMEIFTWVGISSIGIMLFGFVWRNNGIRILKVNIVYYVDLVIYGLNRIPSIIAQFILLAGLPIMIAKTSNLENVAYFNSSLSLLNLSLLITHPIGMVLLPRISRKLARGKIDEISYGLKLALYGGIYFSMMFGIWIFIFAPIILELWLGQIGNIGSLILRGIIISLPFYTIAGLARSPIDAASYKGYNSIIYGIAGMFVVALYYLGIKLGYHPLYVAVTSFVGGQIIAGLSSIIVLNKFFDIRIWNPTLIRDVIIGIFLVISGYYIMLNLGLNRLIIACSIFILGIATFNYYYKNTKGGWVYDFRKLIK